MKYIFIYISLIILFYSSIIASSKWYIEIVDNTNYVGVFSSIELDSNNYPHISYNEYNYDGELRYAYFDGEKWNWEIVDNNGNIQGSTSLILDSKNYPHISYTGNGNLMYAYFDGSEWHKEVIDNNCHDTSIILDSNEHPHISYNKGNPYEDLKYAYFDGTKWNIETVDSAGKVGWYTSIAIDSNDHSHISYDDETNWHLKYAYFDGTKWNVETVDSMIFTGRCTSIAIDSKDHPHISYMRGSGLGYAYFDGEKWNIETVDSDHAGDKTSIALDSNDLPHISYHYLNEDIQRLMYAYYDGKEWHKEIVDEGTGVAGGGTSIALDKYDFPHISYNGSGILKYARYGYGLGIDLTSFTAKPNNNAITLNWSVTADEDISGFNLYCREVLSPVREIAESPSSPDKDYVWTKVNSSLITGTNPYSYTDRDIVPDTTYEYKLEAVVSDKNETLGTTECMSGNPSSFEVTLYPNPIYENDLNIDIISSSNLNNVNIKIYDISGRLVKSDTLNLISGINKVNIDTSSLTSGVYILDVSSGDVSVSSKFVKVR